MTPSRAMSDKPKEEPTSTTPAAPPSPNAPKPIDLTAWTPPKPQGEKVPTAAADEAQERAKDPRAKWNELANIPKLAIAGFWTGTSKGYAWTGATVLLPPLPAAPNGARVFVVTGTDTTAGLALLAAQKDGKLGTGHFDKPVPVTVALDWGPTERPYSHPKVVLAVGGP